MSKFDRYLLTGIMAFGIAQFLLTLNPLFDSMLVPVILIALIDSLFQRDWNFITRFVFGFLAYAVMGLAVIALTVIVGSFL